MSRFVDRVIAAFAALAILVAAQGTIRLESDSSSAAIRASSTATAFAALHSAPAHRLALDSRSSARWPSSADVPVLPHRTVASAERIGTRIAIATAIGRANEPFVARGYDATAPPALS